MKSRWTDSRFSAIVRMAAIGGLIVLATGSGAWSQPADDNQTQPPPDEAKPAAVTPGTEELESYFRDYLHFALIGNFEIADVNAQALLKHPDVTPKLTEQGAESMLRLSEKYGDSIEILTTIITNTKIGENAKKIMKLIRDAHKYARMKPTRIKENIQLLRGTPMQRAVGLERLMESGEYAVPWMLDVLKDSQQQDMHPFVIKALPQLGKRAINPLIEALGIKNDAVKHFIAQALGKIGYPQALPYLKRIATDLKANQSVRQSAQQAIQQILGSNPDTEEKSADQLFNQLAEQYYSNLPSLRPDPREDRANVWFLKDQILQPIEVPREIYMLVMSMRSCEDSLQLNKDQPQTVALWLAANFRRESNMGVDVQSEEPIDPKQNLDLTRPLDYPRSIYFARIAGPRYCQLVLNRAMKNRDRDSRDVALGAVAALNETAGANTMVNPESPQGRSLAEAMQFPDFLVRLKAALALGRAMPHNPFRGSNEVIPVLASALYPADRKFFMVVEPQAASREAISSGLTKGGATVIAHERLSPALVRARKEVTHLDGIFLASDIAQPTIIEAIRTLAGDESFALTPIVVSVKTGDSLIIDKIVKQDKRIGRVLTLAEDDTPEPGFAEKLLAEWDETAPKFGYRILTPQLRMQLALDCTSALESIAAAGLRVYDPKAAQSALIEILNHESEELRLRAIKVLSLLDSNPAQAAIAKMALSQEQSKPLRLESFTALADSARKFGPLLDKATTQILIEQAVAEPDLVIRTKASKALGALNLPGQRAAEIILQAKE
ncbi:MAG: HEAT repeat domain-containing protein [Planctomycetota bacterium]